MKICVTGTQGQVSTALQELAMQAGIAVHCLGRPAFDLGLPDNAEAALAAMQPDVLISAAAYTAVDLAESHAEEAYRVNAAGPAALARASGNLGIPILHLSTDYVFDGLKRTPYLETDLTGPCSVYGASKLEGESAVAAGNPRHVILRTAWVYSHTGKNFLRTMLRVAETNPVVRVVSDQFGCPTYATDLAAALIAMARQVVVKAAGDPAYGTFHMAGRGDTSWAGFAGAIFALAAKAGHASARVVPISTSDYPTPARRPENSRLDCSKLADVFGIELPHWHDGTERCLARLFQMSESLQGAAP